VIDLLAGGEIAALDLLISAQRIQVTRKLADKTLALFQVDIVTLSVGHNAAIPEFYCAPWKSAGLISHPVDKTVVRIRIIEFLN
jgi:hypothetical protein